MNDEYKGLADRRQAAVNSLMESFSDLSIDEQYWRLATGIELPRLEEIAEMEADCALRRRGK